MSAESSFSCRAATPPDAKGVRMLLPGATDALGLCFVAEAEVPARMVAAAGLTTALRTKPVMGPGVAVHVIPPYRHRGIARKLVNLLAENAAKAGAGALYATHKVELGGVEQQAWSALGFLPCETVEYHELLLDEFEVQLAPLLERMRQRGKIPATARILPLCEVDIHEVARLHREILGGDMASLLQKLRGDVPESYSARYSRVLLLENRVVGFILAHRAARDVAHVDANVLAPEVRGGWANVWLKLEATRGALQLGIKRFVFSTFDHYTDTRSFTERLRGVTVQTKVLMYRPLTAP